MTKEEVDAAIAVLESWGRNVDFWVLICAIIVAVFLAAEAALGVAHWLNERQLRPLREKQAHFSALEIANVNKATEELRAKNLELQQAISPRKLTAEQYGALQTLKGKLTRVNLSTQTEWEVFSFAIQILNALRDAGIKGAIAERAPGVHWTATFLYDRYAFSNPSGTPTRGGPLGSVLKHSGLLENGWVTDQLPIDLVGKLPPDIPVIIVGERPPLNNPMPPDTPPHAELQPE